MKKDLGKKWPCLRQTKKKGDCSQPQLATHSWPIQGRTTFYWFLIGSGVLQINSNFLHFFILDLKFGRHHRPLNAQLFLIQRQHQIISLPGINQNPQDWT
jgi:hypothetical protein